MGTGYTFFSPAHGTLPWFTMKRTTKTIIDKLIQIKSIIYDHSIIKSQFKMRDIISCTNTDFKVIILYNQLSKGKKLKGNKTVSWNQWRMEAQRTKSKEVGQKIKGEFIWLHKTWKYSISSNGNRGRHTSDIKQASYEVQNIDTMKTWGDIWKIKIWACSSKKERWNH